MNAFLLAIAALGVSATSVALYAEEEKAEKKCTNTEEYTPQEQQTQKAADESDNVAVLQDSDTEV